MPGGQYVPQTLSEGYFTDFTAPASGSTDNAKVWAWNSSTGKFAPVALTVYEAVGVAAGLVSTHAALTATHGVSGAIVGTTDSQTLSAKTLTTPTIASFTNATHTHTNAAGGGQLDHTTALTNIGTNSHATIDTHLAATATHGATGAVVGTTNVQNIASKTLDNTNTVTLKDTLFTLQDDGDTTKQAVFQLSGITTGTTRTLTVPDASDTFVMLSATQTLTNKTLTTPTIASFVNANHDHSNSAGGGTLTIAGYLPTTGATTGGTSSRQQFTNGLKVGTLQPISDGVTAYQIQSTGATVALNVDTTNNRVGFGGNIAPAQAVDVTGSVKFSTALIGPVLGPASDSTTAFKITKADLSTAVVTVDTTNVRLGIGVTPSVALDVIGQIKSSNGINSTNVTATNVNNTFGSSTAAGNPMVSIAAGNTTRSPLILFGVANQTADYTRWQDAASGNVLVSLAPVAAGNQRQQLIIYNTLETTPTNYERLAIYPDNSNNVFRLDAQVGGTGTQRHIVMQGAAGRVGIGVLAPTAFLHLAASVTGSASLCVPHGTAPTSPVNGDFWTDASGAYIRINGVTKTFTLT